MQSSLAPHKWVSVFFFETPAINRPLQKQNEVGAYEIKFESV